MNLFVFLKAAVRVDWQDLLFGFKRGWVSKSDIASYAVELLSINSEEERNELDVALLASANSLEETEVIELLEKCARSDEEEWRAKEKWRLAKLVCLNEDNSLSNENKLKQLQLIYSEFDYPEDMKGCSIYSQTHEDPLDCMKEVIRCLKVRLR